MGTPSHTPKYMYKREFVPGARDCLSVAVCAHDVCSSCVWRPEARGHPPAARPLGDGVGACVCLHMWKSVLPWVLRDGTQAAGPARQCLTQRAIAPAPTCVYRPGAYPLGYPGRTMNTWDLLGSFFSRSIYRAGEMAQ